MATLHIENDGSEIEIRDGSNLMKACSEAGVPFGCMTGRCGVCRVRILKGAQNLDQPLDANKEILPCITCIKEGEVRIIYRT